MICSNSQALKSRINTTSMEAFEHVPGNSLLLLESCPSGGFVSPGGWQEVGAAAAAAAGHCVCRAGSRCSHLSAGEGTKNCLF